MNSLSSLNSETPTQYFQQGQKAVAAGQLEKAVTLYKKTIELNPNLALYHQNLGDVLAKIGKWEEAATVYQKAIELKPTSALSHYNLGNVQVKQGQLEFVIAS